MKKLIVLFALASVAAAVACGGGDKPAADPSTSTSSGEAAPSGEATPAGSATPAPAATDTAAPASSAAPAK